jgi:hypothetical protein
MGIGCGGTAALAVKEKLLLEFRQINLKLEVFQKCEYNVSNYYGMDIPVN